MNYLILSPLYYSTHHSSTVTSAVLPPNYDRDSLILDDDEDDNDDICICLIFYSKDSVSLLSYSILPLLTPHEPLQYH